ncbi:hypothetical protein GGS21DRAFT_506469 [Xylaria nigripes]|nr:hypothetical protein GGS21DRAFT_506469 [Xylaria nigripes]
MSSDSSDQLIFFLVGWFFFSSVSPLSGFQVVDVAVACDLVRRMSNGILTREDEKRKERVREGGLDWIAGSTDAVFRRAN